MPEAKAVAAGKVPPEVIPNGYAIISCRQHAGGSGIGREDYTNDALVYCVRVTENVPTDAWVSAAKDVDLTSRCADNGDGTETVSERFKPANRLLPPSFARLTIQRTQS